MKKLFFIFIVFNICLYAQSFSDFSLTSYPQETFSIFKNPASLGLMGKFSFSSGYSQLLNNLISNNIEFSELAAGGNFWKVFLGCGYQSFTLKEIYLKDLYLINFGARLLKENLIVATNIKYYKDKYFYDEYYVDDNLARPEEVATNFDFGVIAKPVKNLFFGISGVNLIKELKGSQVNYTLSQKYIFSLSYLYGITQINTDIFLEQTEVNNYAYKDIGVKFLLNQELFYSKILTLDATVGLQKQTDLLGSILSFQIKFFNNSLGLKYSWFYPFVNISNFSGNHYISLNYSLQKQKKRILIKREVPKEEQQIIVVEKIRPQKRKKEKPLYQLQTSTTVSTSTLETLPTSTTQAILVEVEQKVQPQKEVFVSTIPATTTSSTTKGKIIVIKEKEEVVVYKFPLAHKVKEGETLISISKKYYNNEKGWKKIYEANKDKIIKGVPIVGEILIIPEP